MQEIKFSSSRYSSRKIAEFLVKAGASPKTTKKDGIRIGDTNVKHVWSGGRHIFYIPDYLDAEKVTKYAKGYSSGQLSDRSLAWDLKKTIVKQPFDTRQSQGPARDPQGNIIYETRVEKKEQIADIRAWAATQGATVERVYAGSEEEARTMAKAGGIPIRIKSPKELPENIEISLPSPETVRQERGAQLSRVAGKKIYQEAGSVEKSLLHLHTVLSPKGYEYVGAAAREQSKIKPFDVQAKVAGVAMDLVFPDIKTTEDVVIDNVSSRLERHARGEYHYSFDLPLAGRVNIDERIVEAVANPVIDVELMFLGGTGMAKVAATKAGSRVLASTAGKTLLTMGGAAYVGASGYDVYTLRQAGRSTEALGKTIVKTTGIVAGFGGFKMQQAHILKYSLPKKIDVDLSKIKGTSATAEKGKVTVSRGKFKISEGKLKGLRGETLAVTQKKDGVLITKIPAQKVGGQKIEAGRFLAHTKAAQALKTVHGKIYTRISKEGRLIMDTGKGQVVKGPLLGKHSDKTFIREVGRVTRTGTDKTGKESSFLIRKLEGLNIGKSSKQYNIFLVRKGPRVVLVEAKSGISTLRASKLDWIDVSKLSAGGKAFTQIHRPYTPTVTKPGPSLAPPVKAVAVPQGSIQLTARPAVGARIVPIVNPVPTGIRIKNIQQPATLQRVATEPSIVRRTQEGIKGRTVTPTIPKVATPQIVRTVEKARVDYKPISAFYHPITGSKVTEEQSMALRQAVEPVIDRINPQPVPLPIIPVNVKTPAPGLILPSMVPFLRLGMGTAKSMKFETSHIKNPVPDIRKVI